MARPRFGIIADDLTGAADTAAAFARPGRPAAVLLRPIAPPATATVAINTDSRALPAWQARDRTLQALACLAAWGAEVVYKKVDSNLRGNVGAELAAIAEARPGPILLAPAFPARGRAVRDGVALVHGQPVAETEMAHDPQAPVRCSRIADLVRSQAPELPVIECRLEDVRSGPEAILSAVPDRGILVLDAETDDDLATIAQAAVSLLSSVSLAGSAGLARALAETFLGPPEPLLLPSEDAGPVLGVLASASRRLGHQLQAAASAGVRLVSLACRDLSWGEGPLPELQKAIASARAHLSAGRDVLIHATGPLPAVERPVDLVVEHLAHLAFVVVSQTGPQGLLVGGGATAQAVLEALGAEAVLVDDEPEPGIAGGRMVGGKMNGLPVSLKPGAAGGDQALVTLLHYLRRRSSLPEGAP